MSYAMGIMRVRLHCSLIICHIKLKRNYTIRCWWLSHFKWYVDLVVLSSFTLVFYQASSELLRLLTDVDENPLPLLVRVYSLFADSASRDLVFQLRLTWLYVCNVTVAEDRTEDIWTSEPEGHQSTRSDSIQIAGSCQSLPPSYNVDCSYLLLFAPLRILCCESP